MKESAIEVGERLIQTEREIEELFSSLCLSALYTTIFYTSEISVYDDAPLDDRDRVGRP